MNLLHMIDTTGPGGAETIFTELAHQSRSYGCASVALIRGDGWVHRRLTALDIVPLIADCKGSFNVGFLKTLCRIVRQHRIDLIHAHLLGSNVYASLAGTLTRTPVIATFHGSVDIGTHERLAWAKMGLIRTRAHVVAVSEDLRLDIAHQLKMPASAISLIANGIDCQRFAQARLIEKPSSQTRVIGCLGNIRPAKAYDVALRAIAILKSKGRDIKLLIAGDPKEPLQTELLNLSYTLGIGDCVEFVGFVEDPAAFLASLDVFLLTSSSEGHPLALTQAMAAALPIVSTLCGVEKILGAELASFAPTGDSEGVARALETVLDNPAEAAARGIEAQQRAFDLYDYSAMLKRYIDLYSRLVSRAN